LAEQAIEVDADRAMRARSIGSKDPGARELDASPSLE